MDSMRTAASWFSDLREHSRTYFGCRVGSGVAAGPNGIRCWTPAAIPSRVLRTVTPFRRGEQVIVPNGTVTFPVGEISTTTTICDLVHSVRAACGGNYLFGWSRRLRDWVESYYRCHRGRSVDLHFLSRTIGGGHVPSCVQHRYAPF